MREICMPIIDVLFVQHAYANYWLTFSSIPLHSFLLWRHCPSFNIPNCVTHIILCTTGMMPVFATGAELSVLRGLDFSRVSISAIVIECDKSDDSKDVEKISILTSNGYSCERVLRNYFCKRNDFVPSAMPDGERKYTGARNVRSSGQLNDVKRQSSV